MIIPVALNDGLCYSEIGIIVIITIPDLFRLFVKSVVRLVLT